MCKLHVGLIYTLRCRLNHVGLVLRNNFDSAAANHQMHQPARTHPVDDVELVMMQHIL